MEVVVNKNDKEAHFKDIEPGEIFKFNDSYFLKTAERCTTNNIHQANAVSIEDGSYIFFYDFEEIILTNDVLIEITGTNTYLKIGKV